MKTTFFLLINVLFAFGVLKAQYTEQQPAIKVLSRVQKDQILLRFSADSPMAWKLSNTHGYTLERYTVIRDNKTLATPEKHVLGVIKPEPMESWESLIETNDQAAIIAQAIYGESFQVENSTNQLDMIVNQSTDLQQRFTFALYSVEQDFEVAIKAGLAYRDIQVKPNEKYLYKVISNVPESIMAIESGGVFVGLSDFQNLPKPVNLKGFFLDQNVMLSWNFKVLSKVYSGYFIERSEDGKSFKRLNNKPFTTLDDDKRSSIVYTDSIANDKTYYYRVKGISSFSEVGPASNVVSGSGKTRLKFVPKVLKKEIKGASVKISWEFPQQGNELIKGFELHRADQAKGPFVPVIRAITPERRTIDYHKLEASNYFTITAIGKHNDKRSSMPILVQTMDSIAPLTPTDLRGAIDTLGVVRLNWKANRERDLLGYRVYFANEKSHEFSQLTTHPLAVNQFVDTLNIKTLNKKVYYKVSALDKRYNMSELTVALELERPDVIPPSSAVFTHYELFPDRGIELRWQGSSSDDVSKHLIYRKENNQTSWQLVFQTSNQKQVFLDSDVKEGHLYSYTIIAVDRTGLESPASALISVKVTKLGLKPKVSGFYGTLDPNKEVLSLSWTCKQADVVSYQIYKSKAGKPLRLFREVPASITFLKDTNLTINTSYRYVIRAVFRNGNYSKPNEFKINY